MRWYCKTDQYKDRRRISRRGNPANNILISARSRAKNKGFEINIELSDIQIPEVCPILGIPLQVSEGKASSNSPTLDRIHNDLGYVKGNVRVISHRANSMKNDNTLETLDKLIQYIKGEL